MRIPSKLTYVLLLSFFVFSCQKEQAPVAGNSALDLNRDGLYSGTEAYSSHAGNPPASPDTIYSQVYTFAQQGQISQLIGHYPKFNFQNAENSYQFYSVEFTDSSHWLSWGDAMYNGFYSIEVKLDSMTIHYYENNMTTVNEWYFRGKR